MSNDPFANFPGGNPFGPNGPFGPNSPFSGDDPFKAMDEWFKSMGMDPNEMRKMMDDMLKNLPDAFKQMGEDPSKGFVAGFNVRMGPDGKPTFNSFGNKPQVKKEGDLPTIAADEREPLTDIYEDNQTIAITMELPGVEKGELDVNMTEDSLELSVDNDRRKYHKRIKLPAKVDPSTTKASYNNGVLDVTVKKQEQTAAGVKIQID